MSSGSELDLMQSTDLDDGSNNDLTVSSHLEFRDGTKPLITKTGSGHMSPVRARTMKEYDQQIAELQKENFSLKLRIYFLEERMRNQSDDDAEGVFKQNIELKVEAESLKRDLIDKQELLKKASSALTSVTSHHQMELQQTKDAGIAEGKRMAFGELETVKLCIEELRKELNAKHEEVENLVIQSKDTEGKLSDLLAINRQLDSRWRQLERERNSLEMRLEMLGTTELTTTAQEENHETPHQSVTEEVVRKDRLIEQLRCALKAKDVIIEQVEEEKKETIKETTMQLQKKIVELEARVEQTAPEDILLTVESFKDDVGRLRSTAVAAATGSTEGEVTRLQKDRKVTRTPPVLLNAEVQTIVSTQTKDLERLQEALSAREEQLAALNLSVSQHQMENERLKKLIGRRDCEVVQLMDQLVKADESLKRQDDQMKAYVDDGQLHLTNQNETILRLTQSLQQKDQQLEKMLQLSSLADASKTTEVTEMLRDLQKKNQEAVEELIAENTLNVKSRNDEIGKLKKSLRDQMANHGRTSQELAVCHQTIADLEAKAQLTDRTLQQMTNALKDQQMELQEAKDHHGNDISGREKLIRQLMASLPNKDKPLQASQAPLASDAQVSVHSGSADASDLLADLQHQLRVKDDQLQEAETRLHNLTVEMNYLREALLKYRYSESSLVTPEMSKRALKHKDRNRVMEIKGIDIVRASKDSGNLSSSDSEQPLLLSFSERLSVSVADREEAQEIDRNERFQIHGASARMTTEPRNLLHMCYEDKSQQTDRVSTGDEDEIIRLQAEIRHLKMLVNRTVATDSRGDSLTGTPKDRRNSTTKTPTKTISPADDVDADMLERLLLTNNPIVENMHSTGTDMEDGGVGSLLESVQTWYYIPRTAAPEGAMEADGRNQSVRISSQERRTVQAHRHLTLPPTELSFSHDTETDNTLSIDLPGVGGFPNPTGSSFGRECRTTPPRSNISYLSVESSKRWSPEDALGAERSGLEGDGVGQMANSFLGALSSFQALLPDDSTLSEMSNAELKDVIGEIRQKVWNQRQTLPQGIGGSFVSSSDVSAQSRLTASPGYVSSQARLEYDGTKLRQLEKKITEKDREISGLNLRLDKLRTELGNSQQTIQSLKNETRNHQCKNDQDATTLVLESELKRLQDELKSSETTVCLLKEQMENESRQHQHISQDSAPLVLERELNRFRKDLESSERIVHLLKEQIRLNTEVGDFNPILIVRMAKEIDKMKEELALKNENFGNNTQPKLTDVADDRSSSGSHPTTQKIDRATSTEVLTDVENGWSVTSSGKAQMDDSMMDMQDFFRDTRQKEGRQKEGRRNRMSDGKRGTDDGAVELNSTGLGDGVDAGSRILNKSSSGSLDWKMLSGEKKSQIPVLKKSSRSLSLDGESLENGSRRSLIPVLWKASKATSLDGEDNKSDSDAVKCLQLESRILVLEAMIASQSKRISNYEGRLRELDLHRPHEPSFATPSSVHTTSMRSKDQNAMRNNSLTATEDHTLSTDSKGSEGAEGSLALDEVSYKLPSGDHDTTSDLLRQGVLSTPFNDTKAANDRAFVQLKNEVHALKTQLEMYKRENSRLNDTIQMFNEQSLWLPGSSPSAHDASSSSRGTSASADEFLRNQMELRRHDGELQCHLEESHRNCELLRTRLEELLLFMEDLLPLIDTANTPVRLASLRGKLSETRSLLADVSQSFNSSTYDSSSLRMSQTGSYLSRLDLDSNTTARIEEFDRSSIINSVNSKDQTLSERTSESEIGRQQPQMKTSSLDRINRELEQHLHQKDLELASVAAEAASSKSQVAELLDEMEALRTGLRREEEERTSVMRKELVDLKQCNESLVRILEDSRQKLKDLDFQRDDLDKANHHLQVTLADHNTKVSILEQELVDCEARRVKELHQVEEGQLRRLAAFEQEHSILITKIELLTSEVQELRLEVVRERDRSTAAEVARNGCVEKLQEKDSIIRKLKEIVKENQMTAEDLGNQLHRLNADIQEKKLTIQKLNKKCEDLQNSLHQSTISSSRTLSGSLSEMTSVPSTNQFHDIQGTKGSKITSEGFSSTKESYRHPGSSTKAERSIDHEANLLSSKAINSNDNSGDHHRDKDRIVSPTKDYLDHRPTRDTSDSSSGGHLSIIPSGMKLDDPIVFQGGKIPSCVSYDRSTSVECLELIAAQDTIRLLQAELKIFKQRKRLEDAKGEERVEELEEETLEEAMEEVRLLRIQLEQSVQKNDQLREFLMQQAKQTGSEDSLHTAQFGALTNSRDTLQSTRESEIDPKQMSKLKDRCSWLQYDLNQKAIEAIKVERDYAQQSLSATKLKLENALAETRRLKEALNESNELNRTIRLEIRLQEMMTKAENKENERGLSSLSPSRRSSSGSPSILQLSDLMTEIRQLRIQMERTIENNNVLRHKLEDVSRRNPPPPSQSGATKISDSSRTKFSSASGVLKATETTNEESVVDGIYRSQSPKAASLVLSSRNVAMEGKKRDFIAGAVTDSSSADRLVYAVADRAVYERLKEEVSLNQMAIGKLEESIQTIHSQMIEDNRKKDLSEAIQNLRRIADEQTQLIALFWFLNLLKPDKKATDATRVVENELLRKQLADLRQRYARAKHAMKGAQERLEANNRRKEEFYTMQKNKKEEAILEQISKTHQVLAQARQNLEAVHHQTSN